jgi:hypothetical protein
LATPDESKSVTSPATPGAPYDGEWKGIKLAETPGAGGKVQLTVARNAVSGKVESYLGNAQLSGTIASDGSFTGKVGDQRLTGKFEGDRFQGVISLAQTPSYISSGGAVFLERVK